jgi:hypothetical protein
MLASTHGRYNETVKQITEEQVLLNLLRVRYNDITLRLDVSSIAAQYELQGSAEARPFFGTPNPAGSTFRTFPMILPDFMLESANRPTFSLTPLDDADSIRGLYTPSSLDGIIFLAETSYPVSTVYRLFVEYLNRLPNADTASGPPRDLVPEFREFQRAVQLLQTLQDRKDIRFVREEKLSELSGPLPESGITPAALVEAAKSGFEYRPRADGSWVLIRRDRRLELKINPPALASPEVLELTGLLHLQPGLLSYQITVGGPRDPFPLTPEPEEGTTINIVPRSVAQAIYYISRGVLIPPEHLECGIVATAVEPDGTVFDWQQVMGGLFTVHYAKQHRRPECAYVAVKYRGYWFYIDDRDTASKITFSLVSTMARVNLIGVRKGGPALTLPVGR